MTYVYLGNLSVANIEKEHGFEFTEDEGHRSMEQEGNR